VKNENEVSKNQLRLSVGNSMPMYLLFYYSR